MVAYEKAITKTCKDKIVLDLGCGTGVLSAFAVKAGAKEVIGVDNSNFEKEMNAQLNKMGVKDRVKYINESIENLAEEEQPRVPQVDVIVSEWMGYFLL